MIFIEQNSNANNPQQKQEVQSVELRVMYLPHFNWMPNPFVH